MYTRVYAATTAAAKQIYLVGFWGENSSYIHVIFYKAKLEPKIVKEKVENPCWNR